MRRQTKILAAIVISTAVLVLPIAAYAQNNTRGLDRKKEHEDSAADVQKRKADDKAYSDSLSRLQSPQEYDPWAVVRKKAPPEKKPAVVKKKPPVRSSSQ